MKDFGEHGAAKLAEIDAKPYTEKLGEFVSREDINEIPEGMVKWPFKKMLNGQLIIRIDKPPKRGSIIMPQKHAGGRPTKGKVIAKSPEITDIEVGDTVLYSQYAGSLIKFGGVPECRCMSYNELLCVLNDDAPEIEFES